MSTTTQTPSISNLPAVRKSPPGEIEFYQHAARLDPFKTIELFGNIITRSGLFPIQRAEGGQLMALLCLAKNITPLEIDRDYHVYPEGKIGKKSMAALGDFRARGGKHKWLATGEEAVKKEEDRYAEGEFTYEGNTIKVRFSIADAKVAQLNFKDGSNWRKWPAKMLRARVVSNAIAMLTPEIYAGGEDYEDVVQPYVPATAAAPTTYVEPPGQAISDLSRERQPRQAKEKAAEVVKEAEVVQEQKPDEPESTKGKDPEKDPLGDMLPVEIITKLEEAITKPGHEEKAIAWLLKKHWITDSQAKSGTGMSYLAEPHAKQILGAVDKFIKAINA